MRESWVNLYCAECDTGWEMRILDLPGERASYTCKSYGHESNIKEFMHAEKDLDLYLEFKGE